MAPSYPIPTREELEGYQGPTLIHFDGLDDDIDDRQATEKVRASVRSSPIPLALDHLRMIFFAADIESALSHWRRILQGWEEGVARRGFRERAMAFTWGTGGGTTHSIIVLEMPVLHGLLRGDVEARSVFAHELAHAATGGQIRTIQPHYGKLAGVEEWPLVLWCLAATAYDEWLAELAGSLVHYLAALESRGSISDEGPLCPSLVEATRASEELLVSLAQEVAVNVRERVAAFRLDGDRDALRPFVVHQVGTYVAHLGRVTGLTFNEGLSRRLLDRLLENMGPAWPDHVSAMRRAFKMLKQAGASAGPAAMMTALQEVVRSVFEAVGVIPQEGVDFDIAWWPGDRERMEEELSRRQADLQGKGEPDVLPEERDSREAVEAQDGLVLRFDGLLGEIAEAQAVEAVVAAFDAVNEPDEEGLAALGSDVPHLKLIVFTDDLDWNIEHWRHATGQLQVGPIRYEGRSYGETFVWGDGAEGRTYAAAVLHMDVLRGLVSGDLASRSHFVRELARAYMGRVLLHDLGPTRGYEGQDFVELLQRLLAVGCWDEFFAELVAYQVVAGAEGVEELLDRSEALLVSTAQGTHERVRERVAAYRHDGQHDDLWRFTTRQVRGYVDQLARTLGFTFLEDEEPNPKLLDALREQVGPAWAEHARRARSALGSVFERQSRPLTARDLAPVEEAVRAAFELVGVVPREGGGFDVPFWPGDQERAHEEWRARQQEKVDQLLGRTRSGTTS